MPGNSNPDYAVYKTPSKIPELDYFHESNSTPVLRFIVRINQSGVAFRVRADTSGKKRLCHLPGTEFIRRFLLHVLPKGFKRIRHYGLLGPAHKAMHLATARAALDAPAPQAAVIESVAAFLQRVARIDWDRCPQCQQGRFEVVQTIPPDRSAHAQRGPP